MSKKLSISLVALLCANVAFANAPSIRAGTVKANQTTAVSSSDRLGSVKGLPTKVNKVGGTTVTPGTTTGNTSSGSTVSNAGLEQLAREIDQRIAALQSDLDNKDREISKLQDDLDKKETAIDSLKDKISERDTKIAQLENTISESKTKVDNAVAKVNEFDNNFETKLSNAKVILSMQAKTESVEAKANTNNQAAVTEIKNELASAKQEMQNAQTNATVQNDAKITQLQNELATAKNTQTQMQAELTQAKNDLVAANTARVELKSDFDTKMAAMENSRKTLENDLTATKKELADAKADLSSANTAREQLKNKLEADLQTAETNRQALAKELESAKADLVTAKSERDAFAARIGTLEKGDISDVQLSDIAQRLENGGKIVTPTTFEKYLTADELTKKLDGRFAKSSEIDEAISEDAVFKKFDSKFQKLTGEQGLIAKLQALDKNDSDVVLKVDENRNIIGGGCNSLNPTGDAYKLCIQRQQKESENESNIAEALKRPTLEQIQQIDLGSFADKEKRLMDRDTVTGLIAADSSVKKISTLETTVGQLSKGEITDAQIADISSRIGNNFVTSEVLNNRIGQIKIPKDLSELTDNNKKIPSITGLMKESDWVSNGTISKITLPTDLVRTGNSDFVALKNGFLSDGKAKAFLTDFSGLKAADLNGKLPTDLLRTDNSEFIALKTGLLKCTGTNCVAKKDLSDFTDSNGTFMKTGTWVGSDGKFNLSKLPSGLMMEDSDGNVKKLSSTGSWNSLVQPLTPLTPGTGGYEKPIKPIVDGPIN